MASMEVRVLPVRFGFSRPVELLARYRVYYGKLTPVFFPDLKGALTIAGHTLPIVSERTLSADSVLHLLHSALDGRQPAGLLIDLGGPNEKDVTRPNILAGTILAIRSFKARQPDLKVGILLPQAIARNDLLAPMLESLLDDPQVRAMSGDGESWGTYFEANQLPVDDVTRWTAAARADPVENLEKKLVRRVGQYRFAADARIIRHLYDGRYASGEIYDLLTSWLADLRGEMEIREVAYDAVHSPWFRAPVEAALRDVGLLDAGRPIEAPKDAARADVILLPIVRTGNSVREIMKHWKKRGSRTQPKIWTALSTNGQLRSGELRTPMIDGTAASPMVTIDYGLKVSLGETVMDESFWESVPISVIEPDQEDLAVELSADAMWGMVFEAGLIPEGNVPGRRSPVGYVPNFGAMANLNGSFIAAKVDGLLQATFPGSLPPSIAFLCPKEEHAAALAESLRSLAGHDTIHVERRIIEAYLKGGLATDRNGIEDPGHTLEKLRGWSQLALRVAGVERPFLVLLDEFNSSGGTFKGLYNLASAFKLPVLCAISLASFGPPLQNLHVPHLALYDFGRLN